MIIDVYERLDMIWQYLLSNDIATNEELQLITDINGYNEETLNDVLYARTGYRNIEQLMEEDGEDNEDL